MRRQNSQQAPHAKLQLASDELRVRCKNSQQDPPAKLQLASDELRVRRKKSQRAPPADTTFKCSHCGRDKLQALIYDILPIWRKVPESDARSVRQGPSLSHHPVQQRQALLQCQLIVAFQGADLWPLVTDGFHRDRTSAVSVDLCIYYPHSGHTLH